MMVRPYEIEIIQGLPCVGKIVDQNSCNFCDMGDTLRSSVIRMKNKNYYACLVMENGKLKGVMTEHNIIDVIFSKLLENDGYSLANLCQAFNTLRVKDIMTPLSKVVEYDDPLNEVLEVMNCTNHYYLPVMKDGKPFGIVGRQEIVEYIEEKYKYELEQKDIILSYLMSHENYGCL